MKKRIDPGRLPVVLCLTVCFVLGALAGCLFAGVLGADSLLRLSEYLNGYFARIREGAALSSSPLSTVWELCRWPLLVFVLGFTGLGAAGIPAVFLLRGFLMSYSVAVFVRLFGLPGLAAAAAVFGVAGVFALPALFVLGADALGSAGSLVSAFWGEGKRPALIRPERLIRTGGCAALLAAGTALQLWLVPLLVRTAAELFV